MKINKSSFFIKMFLIIAVFFSCNSQAQFEKVRVKMQSGEVIALMNVPWFRFATNIHRSSYASRPHLTDWAIYSPSEYCPTSNSFRMQWQGSILPHFEITKKQCDKLVFDKLDGLPENVKKICDCKLVLISSSSIIDSEGYIYWDSKNDEILKSSEFKLSRFMNYKGELLPILFSLGGANNGIYNYDGSKICGYKYSDEKMIVDPIKFMQDSKKIFPITCIGGFDGVIDISKIHISYFPKIEIKGQADILLSNGEIYVIK